MFDLSGKNALVTGASGGIGRAIAQALHGQGAVVTLSGRRTKQLDFLADELGERAHAITADLANVESAGRLVQDAETAMGQVDILVSNAGLASDGLILRMSDNNWQNVLDVNLTATFCLCRALVRGMMKRRWGRIVAITSVVGATGNAGQTNYAASKAGLNGFCKSLASEVASRGITVNCVAPGLIGTEMSAELTKKAGEKWLEKVPVRRIGTPDDVAACVVFLASDESSYFTGQSLHVNGGLVMI